jgi:hypothetical protein
MSIFEDILSKDFKFWDPQALRDVLWITAKFKRILAKFKRILQHFSPSPYYWPDAA